MSGVALINHSTKPRGGLVHTLGLGEALHRQGYPVHLFSLGNPDVGLFRDTDLPHTVLPAPPRGESLAARVFASIDVLEAALAEELGSFDILHAQDCIAARAAARVRDRLGGVALVRTVHHVDDFSTPELIDCQRRSILEPDRVLVVSDQWRRTLSADYRVDPIVVSNGVDTTRFPPVPPGRRAELRDRIGAGERFLFLAVGGVEPRKGSAYLFEALGQLVAPFGPSLDPPPMLAVVGGHSFQDYAEYRERALSSLPDLGLRLGRDVVELGTIDDAELAGWYAAADALAFPSVNEGWGLAVLEAMSADLPVIATDLPVFREYLTDGVNALLPRVADSDSLATALRRMVTEPDLRDTLRAGGRELLPRFTWATSADTHRALYDEVRASLSAA